MEGEAWYFLFEKMTGEQRRLCVAEAQSTMGEALEFLFFPE